MIRTTGWWSVMAGVALAAAVPLPAAEEGLTWHVSPDGNDAWSGRLAAANEARTDGPLATLAAALKASREKPGQPRAMHLAAGRYFLDATLVLDDRDSGLAIEGAGAGTTVLYGGRLIGGWQPDGDRFWSAPVPKPDKGEWSFRVLVVNDAMRPRARLPATGHFEHETTFPVRWMSTAGGGWERPPTPAELTTFQYRAGDLGEWLQVRNAEVTVYHMWDESTVGVAKHDLAARTLALASPCGHPPGAFGVKRYAVWNVREGMTQPGQWYLDRAAGKVVYWPQPGEDMAKAVVVAPCLTELIRVAGTKDKPATGVAVRGLTLSTGDAPLVAAGFGASQWPGALQSNFGRDLRFENLEITNVGGYAARDWGSTGTVIANSHLHHLGGGGVRAETARIEGNRIHDIGLLCASSIGLMVGGKETVVRRNVVYNTPYSGMCVSGTGTVIEENLLYECMQQLHDGAAIYMGGGTRNTIRGNVVRDCAEVGAGYGVSAYYLDEKCRECVVERNVSINVDRPTQNHMTLDCTLRDNVFITAGDMTLSFPRSSGYRVSGNTFHAGGRLKVTEPDAVVEWERNLVVSAADGASALSDAMPREPLKRRESPISANVRTVTTSPTLDGKMAGDEWPPDGISLGQTTEQRPARGAPVTAKLCTDGRDLLLGVVVVSMFPETRQLGREWGKDEGVEVALEAKRPDGSTCTVALHGFTDGHLVSLPCAGATPADAAALGQAVRYAAAVEKTTWRSEWAVPLTRLGVDPAAKATVPLNLTVFRSEDRQFIQWAGTLGETWDLKYGGRAVLKPDAAKGGAPRPKPTLEVPAVAAAPVLDRAPAPAEWPTPSLTLAETPDGLPVRPPPCPANVVRSGDRLLVRVTVPVADPKTITRGKDWTRDDGAEVCLQGKGPDGRPVVWVIHGFAGGACEVSTEAGAPAAAAQALLPKIVFRATVGAKGWDAEWSVPLDALGVAAGGEGVPFNLGAYRSEDRQWLCWVGTEGPNWQVAKAGLLQLR